MEFIILIIVAVVFFINGISSPHSTHKDGSPNNGGGLGLGLGSDLDWWLCHLDDDGHEHFVDEEGYCEDCDEYHDYH